MLPLEKELSEILLRTESPFLPFGAQPLSELSQASVLVLFRGQAFLNSEVLLTLRANDLATHAGQVAFPGGRMDEGDQGSLSETAIRECEEETGILRHQVQTFGVLPGLPTVSGGYWVSPVLGALKSNDFQFRFQSEEVVDGGFYSVQRLLQSREIETRVVRGVKLELPVFWWNDRKMWGLSALIFDLILKRYDRL